VYTHPTHPSPTFKLPLLCEHLEELSAQCAASLRSGFVELALDLQVRKETVLSEVASLWSQLDSAGRTKMRHQVERIRSVLHAEMAAAADATDSLKSDLLAVGAEQRRLTQLRHYSTASESPAGRDSVRTCG
jgi:hypothetical protein